MFYKALPNGLKVFIFENHKSPIFSFNIYYRVGSMDECPGITGASHLVEHLKFRGSDKFKGVDIDRFVKRHGGVLNGMTNEDSTTFFMALPALEIEYPILAEADLMTNASFTPDDFENERRIVMEERRLQIEDSPIGSLFEALKATAFWAHPYRWSVIGWMGDIANVSHSDILNYYHTNYRPDNAFIVICGDVQSEKTMELIQNHFGKIPSNKTPLPIGYSQEPMQKGMRRAIINKTAELPIVMMGFHACNLKNPNVYPLIVAEKILSSGDSSRIYRHMVHEKQIAVQAGGVFDFNTRDPGLFIFYAQASPDIDSKGLEEALWREVDTICNEKITIEELEKAKNIVEADFIFRREQVIGEAIWRGYFQIAGGMELYDSFVDRIREITIDDVHESCRGILSRNNATVVELIPSGNNSGKNQVEIPESVNYRNFFFKQSKKSYSDELNGLPYWVDSEKFELSNGIRVILYHRDELPIIQIGMLVNAGPVYDPEGKDGLASLTANLLKSGSASRSSDEIAEEIDRVGGEFNIVQLRENAVLGMRFLSRHRKIAFDILSECLMFPLFLEEEVKRYKELQSGEIMSEEDDVWSVTSREFNRIVFKGSPYSHSTLGDLQSVDSLTQSDAREFHKTHFTGKNILLGIIGDFDKNEIRKELEFYFGKMPSGNRLTPPCFKPEALKKPYVTRYSKDLSQASIVLGGYLFPRKSDEYFPYLALDQIFGYGSLTSRIGEKVRAEKGLAYYVASDFINLSCTGYWRVLMQTKNDSVTEAVQLVRDEMRKLREEPVTDEELDDFRLSFKGRSMFDVESNRGLAQKLLTIAYYDLGDDYLSSFFHKINSVTKEQIIKMAKKYLDPDGIHILVVGDESKAILSL